jgi:hypothetical protein
VKCRHGTEGACERCEEVQEAFIAGRLSGEISFHDMSVMEGESVDDYHARLEREHRAREEEGGRGG